MKDRFTTGLIAGLAGGLVQVCLNLISFYLLHFSKTRYLDFTAVLIYGHRPNWWWEAIFAELAYFIFTGLVGIVWAYLFPWIGFKNHLLKGWFLGVTTWFFVYAFLIMFQVPQAHQFPWQTATSNFFGSSVYGLLTAGILKRLEGSSK